LYCSAISHHIAKDIQKLFGGIYDMDGQALKLNLVLPSLIVQDFHHLNGILIQSFQLSHLTIATHVVNKFCTTLSNKTHLAFVTKVFSTETFFIFHSISLVVVICISSKTFIICHRIFSLTSTTHLLSISDFNLGFDFNRLSI
jgi:hypothetical protein